MDLTSLKRTCATLSQERSYALKTLQEEQTRSKEAEQVLKDAQDALELLQTCAEACQRLATSQIAGVVTRCLQAVFGDEAYSFSIQFEQKRSRTEALLGFQRGGKEFSPLSSSGGGTIDVASFALRLAALLLNKPPLRRLLVLDEPWRCLSVDYRPKMKSLLETLARETKVQIVFVTHSKDYEVGEVMEL